MTDVKRKPVSPWRPVYAVIFITFFAPLTVGMLAWNWRRLNKREWFVPALMLSILPLVVSVTLSFVIFATANDDLLVLGGVLLLLASACWTYGLVGAQWYLQGGAWQQYQNKPDWNGLAHYEYPLRNAVLILLGGTLTPSLLLLMSFVV